MEGHKKPTLEDLHDEDVFWTMYSSSECIRPPGPNHNENIFSRNFIWTLFTSFFNCKKEKKDMNDSLFWEFLLSQSSIYITVIHVSNFLFLIALITMIVEAGFINISTLSSLNGSNQLMIIDIIVWSVLSITIITELILIKYFPETLQIFTGDGVGYIYKSWTKIGHFILLVRLLVFIKYLSLSAITDNNYCSLEVSSIGPSAYNGYPLTFIRISILTIETIVFSTLPFPSPWAVLFCLIELLLQSFQIFSCNDVIFENGPYVTFIMINCFLAIVGIFCISGLNASVILISSINVHQNNIRLDAATANKRRFVDLLCTEIRSPLQHVVCI